MLRRTISWMLSAAMLLALLPLQARADEPPPAVEPLPVEETVIPEETAPPEETSEPEETVPPEPGLAAFSVSEPLPAIPFADVPTGTWYFAAVQTLYALELVSGMSPTVFSPSSALTAGQCAALSVRIYAAYHSAQIDVAQQAGERWNDPWMRAARDLDMLPATWAGDQILTRQQALYLLYRTLPASELQPIRAVECIPDLASTDAQYPEILCLYNAGVAANDPYASEIFLLYRAGVPNGVQTANKTGELSDVENDAAIVFAPFGTYVLVILTENGSIRSIRNLSSIIYAAMEQATA